MEQKSPGSWLLLIMQIPPEPGYLRVKIGRRLQRIGAVMLKNSVYVLPYGEEFHEDLEWMLREIETGEGEAMVCESNFVSGINDEQVRSLFESARNEDYRKIAVDAQQLGERIGNLHSEEAPQSPQIRRDLARMKRRLSEVVKIDFFGALARAEAEAALLGLEARLRSQSGTEATKPEESTSKNVYEGRTWVTRAGIQSDRMACAWLIRRFIDETAKFKFVTERGYAPVEQEVRFDMFEAEFTHEGEECSFEVLIRRMGLTEPALAAIAEIIHDIDLKDGKFDRPEAAGIERLISGIAMAHEEDEQRLSRAVEMFDDLFEFYRRSPSAQK